jgi:ATP-dependent Clp protease ATP-binding subunit ClpA
MFERLNPASRQVLEDSQVEARSFHDGFVGPEHLLLALTRQPEIAARLAALGIQREAIEQAVRSEACAQSLDADALAGIGIDLVAVRELVERSFGIGALEAAAVALERRARRRRRGHMKRLAAAGRDPAGRDPAGRDPAGPGPGSGQKRLAAACKDPDGRGGRRRRSASRPLCDPTALRLTATAKEAFAQALQAARATGSATIGPEHLASGVLHMDVGSVAALLGELGVDRESIQRAFPIGPGS